jgi:methylated-DNA-[protein]-cysteine S-methyltransferase
MYSTNYQSPIGNIQLISTNLGLTHVQFSETIVSENSNDILSLAVYQLAEYFSSKRKAFDLPLSPNGTIFQQKVWSELMKISIAQTCSYLHIAKKMGDKNGTRAVGNANRKNPIAIIIPCHRVIGSTGKLTGYAAGVWRKEWLLKHKGVITKKCRQNYLM